MVLKPSSSSFGMNFLMSENRELLSIYSTLKPIFQEIFIKFHRCTVEGNFLFVKSVLPEKQEFFQQENRLAFIQVIRVFKQLVRENKLSGMF